MKASPVMEAASAHKFVSVPTSVILGWLAVSSVPSNPLDAVQIPLDNWMPDELMVTDVPSERVFPRYISLATLRSTPSLTAVVPTPICPVINTVPSR